MARITQPIAAIAALDAVTGEDAGGFYDADANELVVPQGALSPYGEVALAREVTVLRSNSQLYPIGGVRDTVDARLARGSSSRARPNGLVSEVRKALPPDTVADADRVAAKSHRRHPRHSRHRPRQRRPRRADIHQRVDRDVTRRR